MNSLCRISGALGLLGGLQGADGRISHTRAGWSGSARERRRRGTQCWGLAMLTGPPSPFIATRMTLLGNAGGPGPLLRPGLAATPSPHLCRDVGAVLATLREQLLHCWIGKDENRRSLQVGFQLGGGRTHLPPSAGRTSAAPHSSHSTRASCCETAHSTAQCSDGSTWQTYACAAARASLQGGNRPRQPGRHPRRACAPGQNAAVHVQSPGDGVKAVVVV